MTLVTDINQISKPELPTGDMESILKHHRRTPDTKAVPKAGKLIMLPIIAYILSRIRQSQNALH